MKSPEPLTKKLTTWKEIANYLGVSVRTAQAWEREKGLPVHRLPGEKGRIYALASELDEWMASGEQPPVRQWRRWALLAGAVTLAVAAAMVGLYANRHGPPAQFDVEGVAFIVKDAHGRELWRSTFDSPLEAGQYSPERRGLSPLVWFGNLDEDPEVETLVAVWTVDCSRTGVPLICYAQDGSEKWRFTPGRAVSDGQEQHSATFPIEGLKVASLPGSAGKSVLVTAHHELNHPNQFAVLDNHGKPRAEYWHSGHLAQLELGDLDGDGKEEIYLGGVSNGKQTATVVVLDPRDVQGASVEPHETRYQLNGFPPARERARIFFPRTCINRALRPYNHTQSIRVSSGRLEVFLSEASEPGAHTAFRFDAGLNLIDARYYDSLKSLHSQMEASGKLNHPLTDTEIAALRKLEIVRPK